MTTGMTTSWLAARLGVQSAQVEAMRRGDELVGVPLGRGHGHVFPSWQFDDRGKPLRDIPRLLEAARRRGLDESQLDDLVTARQGLTGSTARLADALRKGDLEQVLRALGETP